MLGKRLITAAIGVPAAIYIINSGGLLFLCTIGLLTIVGLLELFTMLRRLEFHPAISVSVVFSLLLVAISYYGNADEMIFVVTCLILSSLILLVLRKGNFSVPDAAITVLSTLYVGWLFSTVILLRNISSETILTTVGSLSAGVAYTWMALLSTWASDTFAYFVGTAFGKHKLCPEVSPGKTVEGAIGGLAGSILIATAVGYLIHMSLTHSLMLGLLIGILAPFGDLVESIFKRYTGVKDSGKFFPGHGGVLDRFDSLLFVAPAAYYYIRVFILG